jgi:hypothetical protein
LCRPRRQLLVVAARFVLILSFFLLAIAGSWFAAFLTVLVLDFVILVVPWHSLQPDSVKLVDVELPSSSLPIEK